MRAATVPTKVAVITVLASESLVCRTRALCSATRAWATSSVVRARSTCTVGGSQLLLGEQTSVNQPLASVVRTSASLSSTFGAAHFRLRRAQGCLGHFQLLRDRVRLNLGDHLAGLQVIAEMHVYCLQSAVRPCRDVDELACENHADILSRSWSHGRLRRRAPVLAWQQG